MRLISFLLILLAPSQVIAHAPYYSQIEQLQQIEGESFTIKLLHGDGIITTDPVRAIVVDSKSRIRAISPLGVRLHINCGRLEEAHDCVVYDSVSSLIYEVAPSAWAIGPVVEKEEKPLLTAYPEGMGLDFGFLVRPATFSEIVRFESAKIRKFPLVALWSLIWWTVTALFFTPIVWRIFVTKGDFRSWSASIIVWDILRLLCAAGCLFLAIVIWAWESYSLYYAAFFAAAGLSLALLITRPRRDATA
ncbi:hypothetical protein J7382_08565 [Shimia sp. R11_0]|uniref:hypothetical protein n=1 Tax=Shimia sp. R11_0 TaxID=2821096 RepID=UPI001ADAA8D1|nr:hypothetical protein [Shimia sp. R11_0]MBO9477582.1 hypothetical protein [Shimia sp. R11_0]